MIDPCTMEDEVFALKVLEEVRSLLVARERSVKP